MTTKNSRDAQIAADQKLADGIQKHQAQLPPTVTAGSQTMTPGDVVTVLQGWIATAKAADAAETARTAAVKADRDKRTATQPQVSAFRRLIIAMYLESPDVLGDYGLTAPKPPTMTAQERAAAAAKAAATRKALGTKGAQQKRAAIAAMTAGSSASSPAAAPAAAPAASGSPAAPAVGPAQAPTKSGS
ncbi:MAG TPA: hypothetical protein VIF09_20280 [Polyangiaceae bacterium]|jgi:hypothetical protein